MKKPFLATLTIGVIAACGILFVSSYQDARGIAVRLLQEAQSAYTREVARDVEELLARWTGRLGAYARLQEVIDIDAAGRRDLRLLFETHQDQVQAVVRLDERGVVRYSHPFGDAEGRDASGQDHVREILRTRQPVFSEVVLSVQGIEAIELHVPVFEGARFRGTLGILVDFESFAKRHLAVTGIGAARHAWVVSRGGRVLFASRPGLAGTAASAVFAASPQRLALLEDMLLGRQGTTAFVVDRDRDGALAPHREYAAYAPIRLGNTHWSVAVAASERELLASLDSFRNRLIAVVGLLAVAGVLIMILVARSWLTMKKEEARGQAERLLRESEEKYHSLYRESTLGIFHSTLEGRFIDVNPALARMLGYDTPEEVLAAITNIAEQVYAEPPLRDEVARQALAAGGVLTRENRYRRKDGSLWWGLLHLRSLKDSAGRPSQWEGLIEDITERRRVGEELRESEERFATLFRANPAAVAVTRLKDSLVVDVNEAWQTLTGYPRETIVGHPTSAFNLWADTTQRERAIRQIQEHGKARIETQLRTKAGELRDVLMSGDIVTLSGERHLLTIALDISERKQAEQQLQYQANLLANVSDAVVATDRDFNVGYWNAAAEKQYGWSAAEVCGTKFTQFIQTRFVGDTRRTVMRAIARQGFWRGELLHNRRDGTLFPVMATISEVRAADQHLVGHVAVNRDITALKQAERALQLINTELTRSNAELERFAYAVSHDLQEPLRMIASFMELIEKRSGGRLDGESREYCAYAQDGAHRMQQMIDDLLRYSRVTTRGQAFAPVPLAQPLKAALDNLALALEESGGVVVHDALPTVLGDASQLLQLFQNLIGNALKFRRPGVPPRIAIRALPADRASGVWTVSVQDNGIGIEPQFFERIFVVFQRLHARDEYPGTGIGLAICRRILERHGGRIWVEATVGAGSTFFFTLPAAQ